MLVWTNTVKLQSELQIFTINMFVRFFVIFSSDTTPPTIICPEDMTVPTQPNLHYAILNISLPKAEGKKTTSSVPKKSPSLSEHS